jgi:broad specificity phosphatase PhoE
MKITYFVHSITTDNEQGLATGWLQGELSEEGVKRAEELGQQLADRQFDAVFSSDLRRAVHSTELFFNGRLPTFIDWRLRECDYGDLDGQPAHQFKKDREEACITEPYANGESYVDVERRMRSFLNDAAHLFPDGHIAIVAHQAPQLALNVILKGKTWEQAIAEDWRKTKAWQAGWEYTK